MLRSVVTLVVCCGISAPLLGAGGACGGGAGGGFGGFGGGSSYPFELPKVEEDVDVAGVTLKLNRTKWGYSVFASSADGPLARFVGEDIEVTLRRIASPAGQRSGLGRDAGGRGWRALCPPRLDIRGDHRSESCLRNSPKHLGRPDESALFPQGRRIELALFRGSCNRQVPAVARCQRPDSRREA